MSVELKLTDYLPAISELSAEDVLNAEERIRTYLAAKDEFKTVDMRPNSVFGDLILSPLSHLIAAFEIGANRMFSDTDLANVAAGTIYNCDFVKQYLNNFGQGQVYEYPSTGVIQLAWSSPATKVIDVGTKFLFAADDASNYIYSLANVDDFVVVRSPWEKVDITKSNEVNMIRLAEDKFVANFPVTGPAGVGVNAGTVAATDLSHSDLISVTALGAFDRGTLPENIMELANKVQRTFYSSSLNNRTGAISFLLQAFPELRGVSPVISGDSEMLRDRTNILGVHEGKMDLFVKSRTNYLVSEQQLKLTYNTERNLWLGTANVLEPMVYVDGVRRFSKEEYSPINDIVGSSRDEIVCPSVSAAFSNYEKLGFSVVDYTSPEDIMPSNVVNGELNADQHSTGFKVSLLGNYSGDEFSPDYERSFSLFFVETFVDTDGEVKVKANLTDTVYEEFVTQLIFKQDPGVPTRAVLDTPEAWESMIPGVTLKLEHTTDAFNDRIPLLLGVNFDLKVTGRGGLFSIKYRYDPNYSLINSIVTNEDVLPVNMDIVTKNFLTCYVEEIAIEYKKKDGQNVDLIKSTEEIVNYVNKLTYPNLYEEYTIAEILLFYGAAGVRSITQKGKFSRSLANSYRIFNEDRTYEEVDIDNPYTTTLQPDSYIEGLGERNVNYILDSANIKFNAITI